MKIKTLTDLYDMDIEPSDFVIPAGTVFKEVEVEDYGDGDIYYIVSNDDWGFAYPIHCTYAVEMK